MNEFLGIPYAKPPVNALRWQKPEALDPNSCWKGTHEASQFGSECIQISPTTGGKTLSRANATAQARRKNSRIGEGDDLKGVFQ